MANLDLAPSEAKRLLAPHIASGKQLVLSSSLVGDPDDFDVWTWKCKDWTARLRDALRYIYGDEAARTFEAATSASVRAEDWQDSFRAELERLQHTVDLLTSLVSELGGGGSVREDGVADGSPGDRSASPGGWGSTSSSGL